MKNGKAYDGIEYPPVFGPDSKRLANFAHTGLDWIVVIDGKESPLYQGLINNSFGFSPDGQRYAYAAYRKDKFVVVIDGNESQECENFGAGVPAFSPESRHVVWGAPFSLPDVAMY